MKICIIKCSCLCASIIYFASFSSVPSAFARNDVAGMCTAIAIKNLEKYGLKKGDKIWHITQVSRDGESLFFCAWGDICYTNKEVRLYKIEKIQGDIGRMNGVEIKKHAYESQRKCMPDDLK